MQANNLPAEPRAMSTLGKVALTCLVLVLLGSIGARALLSSPAGARAGSAASAPESGSGLLPYQAGGQPGETGTEPASEDGWGRALPYLTEGSFFALIGFALGYAARKVLKLGLVLIAVSFAVLQGLAFAGVITIDWQQAWDWARGLVLNVRESEALAAVVQHRIPSVGALAGGWLLGLKSG